MSRCLSLWRQMPVSYVSCPWKPLHIFSLQVSISLYQRQVLCIRFYSKHFFQTILILGDYIFHAGDMGREMYCVRRGLVEVIGDDDVTVVSTLGTGAYFGEVRNDFVTLLPLYNSSSCPQLLRFLCQTVYIYKYVCSRNSRAHSIAG